jgi:hypothetical protein
MRVIFRIILTLLVALPVVLGMAVFFALQVLRGDTPAPEGGRTLSSDSGALAEADSYVHYAGGHTDQHQGVPAGR